MSVFSDFQNFFGFLKFREKHFFRIYSKFPMVIVCVVVAYSLTSTDVDREVRGSKPTIVSRNSHEPENTYLGFAKVLLRFTRTCTTQ